ncbi:MAG: hypothetical protein KBC33_03305 [Candidatus Pacebacteria bacterium]|nr:hypothetical protein [Candidatus Paceibacterota bacterium]
MKKLLLLMVAFVSLLLGTQNASSLTIIRNYIGGTPPTNSTGTGNLITIVNAACDVLETAILDDHVITINYGWAPIGGGQHALVSQDGIPSRETCGTVLFNNDNDPHHFSWYLDPSPLACTEATNYVEECINLGSMPINSTRFYQYPSSSQHMDLFTAVLHEVGHALGMSYGNYTFIDECVDSDIDVASGPYAQTHIPLQTNFMTGAIISHIDYVSSRTLMSGSWAPGERVMPSALDILAWGQLCGFTKLNFDMAPVLTIGNSYVASDGKTKAKLSWIQPIPPPPGTKYVVQGCSDLTNNSWSKVNGTIANNNGKYSLTVQLSGSQKFFRLMAQ